MLLSGRHHRDDRHWLKTSLGDDRGYIEARGLEELWFHTGTRCNLSCPFCLEGSGPLADRLDDLTLGDVEPLLKEAHELGCRRFSFTGGEPFLNREFISILTRALDYGSCLVLTNATKPLHHRLENLERLRRHGEKLKLRVSLDHPDAHRHDEGRGQGNFERALEGLRQCQGMGYSTSVACQWPEGQRREDLEILYRDMLKQNNCDDSIPLVFFPDFLPPGMSPERPEITTDCMTRYHDEKSRATFMCSFSRMVIKRDDQIKVTACTLVDDDEGYDLSEGSLAESLDYRVTLGHHRCFSCFSCGASCSEG